MLQPQDGLSLKPLFAKETGSRTKPLPFQSRERVVVIDNDYKLLSLPGKKGPRYELYNLAKDHAEETNLVDAEPKIAARLRQQLEATRTSIAGSVAGKDYPKAKSARNRRAFSGIPSKLTNRTSPNGSSGRVLQLAPKTIEIK